MKRIVQSQRLQSLLEQYWQECEEIIGEAFDIYDNFETFKGSKHVQLITYFRERQDVEDTDDVFLDKCDLFVEGIRQGFQAKNGHKFFFARPVHHQPWHVGFIAPSEKVLLQKVKDFIEGVKTDLAVKRVLES